MLWHSKIHQANIYFLFFYFFFRKKPISYRLFLYIFLIAKHHGHAYTKKISEVTVRFSVIIIHGNIHSHIDNT